MNIAIKDGYELMALVRPRSGNYAYAIIHRTACSCQPFVFCSGYDMTYGDWAAGHYFDTYDEAYDFMIEYLRH